MSATCTHCDSVTVWVDAVASSVCTSCASLVDPTQSVFTTISDWHDPVSTTLKSLRSRNNWDLSGQGREARDRRHAFAMAAFINSLAASFNVPGLAPRSITLFNQVRNVSNFRWGNKSRSIAAACLAIALRESNRPDALRDIASVLQVPPTSVTREFTHITSSLGLSLTLADPSVYIPTLHAHLSSSLTGHHNLPTSLSQPLGNLNLHSVNETAVALSLLLARLSPGHHVLRLPVPPTACAIFILALEGDLRAPLNPLGDIAICLGARFQVAKCVVMTRYKTIQDEIASWVETIPWLDKYESKGGRAKVSKRHVVARGLQDVIRFQEDIWQKRAKPIIPSELLVEDDVLEQGQETKIISHHPKPTRVMGQAIQFLLDPLNTPILPLGQTYSGSRDGPLPISQLSLATYLLTSPFASGRLPTRLQLLACLRGGSTEDKIRDNELFAEGELENLFRDENEVRLLRETLGWDKDDIAEEPHQQGEGSHHKGKRKRAKALEDVEESGDGIVAGSAFRPPTTRLNIEALAQFMSKDHGALELDGSIGLGAVIDEVDLEHVEKDSDEDEDPQHNNETIHPLPKRRRCAAAAINSVTQLSVQDDVGEVVLAEWHPPSPGGGVTYNDSHYEEEYD